MIYRLVCAFIIISLSTFMPFLASANETSSRNPNFFDTPILAMGGFAIKILKSQIRYKTIKITKHRFLLER